MSHDFFRPRIVRASAGSGKTFELSNHYLALLAAGERGEKILATTFTRKAAGEILERVFQRLAAAALSEEQARELGEHIGAALSSAEARQILVRLVRDQHRLRVCTFDSFFVSMALGFGLELGLPPGWKVADKQHDTQVCDRAIERIIESNPREAYELLALLDRGASQRSVFGQIRSRVTDLHGIYREAPPNAWRWLPERKRLTREELTRTVDTLSLLEAPRNQNGKPDKNWEKAMAGALEAARSGDWRRFVSQGLAACIATGGETFQSKVIPAAVVKAYRPLIGHACAHLWAIEKECLQAAAELLVHFDRAYESERQQLSRYGFGDIKHKLARAAQENRLTELYFRLDSQIGHLLLDEFQDTSRDEWLVIEQLVDEVLAEAGHAFFCVGDVKQAIYGWRGGVAEIFNTLEQRWPQLASESRELSYRCAPVVLETVNRVFSRLEELKALETVRGAAAEWQQRFREHSSARPSRQGHVQLIAASGEEEVCRRAALLVRDLASAHPAATIGVLVRRNKRIGEIMFELGRADVGVKASEEGGSDLTDSPLVAVILSLLELADHPRNLIARFHVAHSPLAAVVQFNDYRSDSGADALAHRTRSAIQRLGLASYLRELCEPLTVSAHDRKRLQQLVGVALEQPSLLRVSDFAPLVRERRVDDPSSSQVRVMTVHGSKGLEFDIVVLAELDVPVCELKQDRLFVYRPDPFGPPTKIVTGARNEILQLEPEALEVKRAAERERAKESLSLLYVAMTRAAHALYLIIGGRDEGHRPRYSNLLAEALAEHDGEVIFERGTAQWRKEAGEGPLPRRRAEQKRIVLAPAARRRGRALVRESPSALEGGAEIDLLRRLRVDDRSAAERGLLLHRFFELVEWAQEPLPSAAELRTAGAAITSDTALIEECAQEFLKIVAAPEIRTLLSRSSYPSTAAVLREQPFAFRDDEAVLSGRFDRLVLWSGHAEVIDFKSDALSGDAALEERLEYYRPQMVGYREAAGRVAGIPPKDVTIKLAFVTLGRVCEVR